MLIPEGFAQVNFVFTGIAAPTGAQCTLGVAINAFAGTPVDAAHEAGLAWVASILPQQSASITLSKVMVKFGPNSTGLAGEEAFANNGGDAGTSDPPNIALLVQKITGMGGRTGRGRMFIPGWSNDAFNSSGAFAAARITAVNGELEDFRDAMIAADLVPVLLHSETSPAEGPNDITALTLSATGATQRRRLRR